jgi:hypothetical protein
MAIIKDLVPDLNHVLTQFSAIKPWFQTRTTEPERERLQSPEERRNLDGSMSPFSVSAAPPAARVGFLLLALGTIARRCRPGDRDG